MNLDQTINNCLSNPEKSDELIREYNYWSWRDWMLDTRAVWNTRRKFR